MHQANSLKINKAIGKLSQEAIEIHHGKLYQGYVDKRNQIEQKLSELEDTDWQQANQIYSQLRGLKEGETFAANGMILHGYYFAVLGGENAWQESEAAQEIIKQFGTIEQFRKQMKASAMAARGWAILAFDLSDKRLHIYTADAQNQGAVWGALPIIALDVYEHSYFKDFGADRGAYIDTFLDAIDWQAVDRFWLQATKMSSNDA